MSKENLDDYTFTVEITVGECLTLDEARERFEYALMCGADFKDAFYYGGVAWKFLSPEELVVDPDLEVDA
jgi:hypothetical protein